MLSESPFYPLENYKLLEPHTLLKILFRKPFFADIGITRVLLPDFEAMDHFACVFCFEEHCTVPFYCFCHLIYYGKSIGSLL